MNLFQTVKVSRLLDPDAPGHIAITENDHGLVYAFGDTPQHAIANLIDTVQALRNPDSIEPFKTRVEWQAAYRDWLS